MDPHLNIFWPIWPYGQLPGFAVSETFFIMSNSLRIWFPYHSHVRIPKAMGIVWVPLTIRGSHSWESLESPLKKNMEFPCQIVFLPRRNPAQEVLQLRCIHGWSTDRPPNHWFPLIRPIKPSFLEGVGWRGRWTSHDVWKQCLCNNTYELMCLFGNFGHPKRRFPKNMQEWTKAAKHMHDQCKFHSPFSGVIIAHQPKQCTIFVGNPSKITIHLHQVWSPPEWVPFHDRTVFFGWFRHQGKKMAENLKRRRIFAVFCALPVTQILESTRTKLGLSEKFNILGCPWKWS